MSTEAATQQAQLDEKFESTARLFKALAHPTRLRLVCGLLRKPTTQTRISKMCNIPQSSLAQHLAVLRREGIITGRRDRGAEVVLEVTDPRVPRIFQEVCGSSFFLDLSWDDLC